MKKWFPLLAAAFAVYLIFSSPAVAGAQARTFAGWLGDLAGAAGEFLDGLFAEEATVESNDLLDPNQGSPGVEVTIDAESGATTVDVTPTTAEAVPDPDEDTGDGDSSDDFG